MQTSYQQLTPFLQLVSTSNPYCQSSTASRVASSAWKTFSCIKGTANGRGSHGVSTNISCAHSSSGPIPTTSSSSSTRSGEIARSTLQQTRKGNSSVPSRY